MEIFWKNWEDDRQGPDEVVAGGDACLFIKHKTKPNIIIAIPFLLIVASIALEKEEFPDVFKYVLENNEISAVDYHFVHLVKTVN